MTLKSTNLHIENKQGPTLLFVDTIGNLNILNYTQLSHA